jgi:hypothetical protein
MRFGYLKDPLFLACVAIYFAHRGLAAYGLSLPLLKAYLNDVICAAFWVPIMLAGERLLGVRATDGPPQPHEVAIPILIWAIVFEVVLPRLELFRDRAIADPLDVPAYTSGALGAMLFWRWWYGAPHSRPDVTVAG